MLQQTQAHFIQTEGVSAPRGTETVSNAASPEPGRRGKRFGWLALGFTALLFFIIGCVTTFIVIRFYLEEATVATESERILKEVETSDVARALELIRTAQQRFEHVQDYKCLFLRDEWIDGEMNKNILNLKVRHVPFSVQMEWIAPPIKKDRKVAYIEGKNNGKMLVKQLITLKLDPQESVRRKESRHTILQAGLKNMINRYATSWEKELRMNSTQVTLEEREEKVSIQNRDFVHHCIVVTTTHDPAMKEHFLYAKAKVYFDRSTGLPVRSEGYDWPEPGQTESRLAERFTYLDLRTNLGLKDADFEF